MGDIGVTFFGGSGGGVDTVGTFSATSETNGAAIAAGAITFGPADSTNPGMIQASGAQTLAPSFTFSATGASGAGALKFTGTPFAGTGTTSKPLIWSEWGGPSSTNWNTNGTVIGVNSQNGWNGNYIDLQQNGISYFNVNGNNNTTYAYNYTVASGNGYSLGNGVSFSNSSGIWRISGGGGTLFSSDSSTIQTENTDLVSDNSNDYLGYRSFNNTVSPWLVIATAGQMIGYNTSIVATTPATGVVQANTSWTLNTNAGAGSGTTGLAVSTSQQVTIGSGTPQHTLNTLLATGSGTSTLGAANSPGGSTPAGWIQITVNGTTRYMPFF